MGKIRKTRPGRVKKNESVEDTSLEEEIPIDSKENAIQTCMDQLQVRSLLTFHLIYWYFVYTMSSTFVI